MTPLKLFSELLSLSLSSVSTEAVADMCEEFIPPLASTGKSVAMVKSESLVSLADLLNVQRPLLTNELAQGNLLQNHKERVENFPDDEQLIKIMYRCRIHKKRLHPDSIL